MDVLLFESLGIGAVLGLLLGLTGAGGSLVALPLLLSLHLPLRDAIGVSLGAVALSALIGAIPRARQGQVAWRPVLVLALAGLPSNAVGQWLGRFVPEGVLIVAFCLLVLWSAWRMWRGAGMKREASDQARSLPLLGIGLAVGLLSGLMGVGGGFLVVPGLLWFTPLSMMAATATSMAVIALVSGGGFLIYLTGAAAAARRPRRRRRGRRARRQPAGAAPRRPDPATPVRADAGGGELLPGGAEALRRVAFLGGRGTGEAALSALRGGHAMAYNALVHQASAGSPGKDRRRDCLS